MPDILPAGCLLTLLWILLLGCDPATRVRSDGGSCIPAVCGPNMCGDVSNNCGGIISCGGCDDPQTCGGGGEPNICAVDNNIIVQIATGTAHVCIVTQSGSLRCWGKNNFGQLGYGNLQTIGDNEHPYEAGNVDVGGPVKKVSLGNTHTCVLMMNGGVRCWGDGDGGKLGYGITPLIIGDDEAPSSFGEVPLTAPAIDIAAGETHSCAVLQTGDVQCWGFGSNGVLGYADTANRGDDETPASYGTVMLGAAATQITAGSDLTCALLTTGKVRCWGWAGAGALGYGNDNAIGDDETPARLAMFLLVASLRHRYTRVSISPVPS